MKGLAEKLLAQIDGVRATGQDRWVAKCPAHEDRTPSLAIREVDECLLIYCFAGCSTYDVISAAGLDLSDLFPPRPNDPVIGRKAQRRPFPAVDILRGLSNEITALMLCASDLEKGKQLDAQARGRLLQATSRFHAALSAGALT